MISWTLRRCALQILLVLMALSGWAMNAALAQDAYPSRVVKFINNFPPGGPPDILARSVAQALQERADSKVKCNTQEVNERVLSAAGC